MSLPVRGAWVEIPMPNSLNCGERGLKWELASAVGHLIGSLPVRGAWVEIAPRRPEAVLGRSLPVRGAWVEILLEK